MDSSFTIYRAGNGVKPSLQMEELQETPVKSTGRMYICEVCGSDFIQKSHLTRHMRIHTKETFVCRLCSKPFSRRDKLNCHISRKHQTIGDRKHTYPCLECGKIFGRKFHLKRHKLMHKKTVNGQAVLDEMKCNAHLHKEQLELGKDVANNLQEYDDIPEQSLSATHKQALELYKQSRVQHANRYENVTLRLWQHKVISFIDAPHLRQVIWIVGTRGNEGKTFLQNYISNYYGSRRVVATDIAGRKKNIAHYLAKLPLECKDIFLFNHPASASEAVAYDLLEDIKDGRTRSDKYSTEQVMFKTPNTVMVFSNEHPRTEALKKDRWRIYEIIDEELCHKNSSTSKPSRLSFMPDKIRQPKYYHYYWHRVKPREKVAQGCHRLLKSFFGSQVGLQKLRWSKQCWDFPPHHWARTDVCGTSEKHESCSKNRMWLMQFPQRVVQCQKRLADVLGPINREPSPHSLQLPGWITAVWITGKMEDGISLCVLWMWYQLQRTQRDSWTRNRIRTSFLW